MLSSLNKSLWQSRSSQVCGAGFITPRNDEGYAAQWVRGGLVR